MNCTNCGASLELFEKKDYTYNQHCGAFDFPPDMIDGVRISGSLSELDCPVCKVPHFDARIGEFEIFLLPELPRYLDRNHLFCGCYRYSAGSKSKTSADPRPHKAGRTQTIFGLPVMQPQIGHPPVWRTG